MEKCMCPFFMDKCVEKCVFYRRGIRNFDDGQTIPFEDCAFNIAVDCLENLVTRNIALQKEMNTVRNSVETMTNVFKLALIRSGQKDIDLKEME